MKRKVVLTCAVTGDGPIHPKFPDYPKSPAQIAAACLEAAAAGASVVHIHGRDPQTGLGDRSPAVFAEIVRRVRAENKNIVINLTTGMGATFVPDPANEAMAHPTTDVANAEDRVRHVLENRPEICTLDVTTMNLEGGIAGAPDCIFMNTPGTLSRMAALTRARTTSLTATCTIWPPAPPARPKVSTACRTCSATASWATWAMNRWRFTNNPCPASSGR